MDESWQFKERKFSPDDEPLASDQELITHNDISESD